MLRQDDRVPAAPLCLEKPVSRNHQMCLDCPAAGVHLEDLVGRGNRIYLDGPEGLVHQDRRIVTAHWPSAACGLQ